MEYQELINIWNSSNAELQTNVQINRALVKEVAFKKVRSNFREIKWTSFVEIIVGFFWIIFLTGFIFDNLGDFKFSGMGIILLVMSIFSVALNSYKLKLYYSVNPRFSVFQTQKQIERLEKVELLNIQSLYIIIPLFSAPFAIVVAKAFFNVSLFSFGIFGKALLYYTFGAVLVAVILVFFLKMYSKKNFHESIGFLSELKEDDK